MERGHPVSHRMCQAGECFVQQRSRLSQERNCVEMIDALECGFDSEREFQNWKSRRGYVLSVEQNIAYTTKRGAECTQQSRRDRKGAFDRPDHEARPL